MHPFLQRQQGRFGCATATRTHHSLRAIFGIAALASILSLAAGCDKANGGARELHQTSLANKPRTLFLLFGDKADPRVLPLATLADGKIEPIVLDASGWRNFDELYFPAGAHLSLYEHGKTVGDAVVRRGMWEGTEPLYKLPGCKALRPLAAVTLTGAPSSAVMLELLATSAPILDPAARPAPSAADMDSANAFAMRVAQHEGFTATARTEMDLVVAALPTGATAHPTLMASFMDKGSGPNGKPRNLFALGDWSESTHSYVVSFVHVPAEPVREFRRLIDHVDLTGDGVDEVVVEGWRARGDSYLIILRYQNAHWREMARGATSWCADHQ
ncbi:MAG: hypothetical protein ABJA80_17330 [bacterium]